MIIAAFRETKAFASIKIISIDTAKYKIIPNHTRDKAGIFPEKLLILIAEKKKGKKKIRYIKPIDIQAKASIRLSSRFPLLKKNARRIMPAPAKNNKLLKIND
jgi:hypothetical protein